MRRLRAAEIGGFELGIGGERGGTIRAHDASRFQKIAAIGDGERKRRHLIDKEDGDPGVAQFGQDIEQFIDHAGRETERRLVQQNDPRFRHQAARDGEHLLLTAGEKSGAAVHPLAQPRKAIQNLLNLSLNIRIGPRIGAERQIVEHAQIRKNLAAFRHQREAGGGDAVGFEVFDALVVEHDLAAAQA